MAVRSEHYMPRLYIACLRHQLMADAITSVNIFDAILLYKCVSHAEMAGVVLLAGRNQMVIDQNNLIRIPYLSKAHLVELVHDKRNHDVI